MLLGSVHRVQAVTAESFIEAIQEKKPTLDWSAMALEGKLDIAMLTATQSLELAQIKGLSVMISQKPYKWKAT